MEVVVVTEELDSLAARVRPNHQLLQWSTMSEINRR
jgi:hypothetical protein